MFNVYGLNKYFQIYQKYVYIFKEIESMYFGMNWTEAFRNVSKIKKKTYGRN